MDTYKYICCEPIVQLSLFFVLRFRELNQLKSEQINISLDVSPELCYRNKNPISDPD